MQSPRRGMYYDDFVVSHAIMGGWSNSYSYASGIDEDTLLPLLQIDAWRLLAPVKHGEGCRQARDQQAAARHHRLRSLDPQNQDIQHPLAVAWIGLESANLMTFEVAALHDSCAPCGAAANAANAANYLAPEGGIKAAETAALAHRGYVYVKDVSCRPADARGHAVPRRSCQRTDGQELHRGKRFGLAPVLLKTARADRQGGTRGSS